MEWQTTEVTYEQYLANPTIMLGSYSFVYSDSAVSNKTTAKPVLVSSTVTFGDEFDIFTNESAEDLHMSKIDNTKFFVQRKNQINAALLLYEYLIVENKLSILDAENITENISILNRIIENTTSGIYEYTKLNNGYTSIKQILTSQKVPENILGFAKNDAINGQTVFVANGHEIEGFSGLVKGSTYYLDDDGGLSLTEKTMPGKIGVALSDTKIKLFKQNRGI